MAFLKRMPDARRRIWFFSHLSGLIGLVLISVGIKSCRFPGWTVMVFSVLLTEG